MRFDNLPMDRSAQAAGSGEAVFERREEDPSYPLGSKRRPGSLRQDDYAPAPGLRCEADAAYGYFAKPLDTATGFTVSGSLSLDSLDDTTPLAILQCHSVEDASSDTESLILTATRTSATQYTLTATLTDSLAATVTVALTGRTFGTDQDIVMGLDDGTSVVRLLARDVGGANSDSGSSSYAGLTRSATNFYVAALGAPDAPTKTTGQSPVFSNLSAWESYAAGIIGSRDPASATYYWSMRDPYRVMASEGTAAGYFHLHPAAPAIVSSAAQFGGRSGAIHIEPSIDTERFFSTAAESVADKEFTVLIKGTRGNRGATGREEVLFDYGDLCQIAIQSDDTVDIIYNGSSASSTATIASDAAFTIYAGRNGANLFINVDTAAQVTDTAAAPPYLDLSAAPSIYVGAEADVAQDTRYVGALTTVALWPEYTLTDLGARRAAFYLDLTDAIEDRSPNGAAVTDLIHSSDSGDPHFTAGPIADAAYRAPIAGLVLSDTGPTDAGWDSALDARIEGDVTGLRVGRRVFSASQDKGHIFDTEALVGRPFGVPRPPPGVTTTSIGSGLLDGAYGYGYRFLSRDGTYGPVRRLDPIAATSGARVVIGSSGGSGDSELGETYGDIPASTTSNFKHDATGDPGVGTFVKEIYARLLDHEPDEIEETTLNRGAVPVADQNIAYLESGAPSPLNLGEAFTLQCDFRYRARAGLSPDGLVSTAIVSSCPADSSKNADFFAAILHDTGGDISQGKYDGDYPNNDGVGDAHYGDTEPRLVVGIARRATRADIEFSSGRNFPSENYFLLTFSDDSTWTDGNDYSVIFQRTGENLQVYVQDKTAGGAYTLLTSRTMAASGVATSHTSTGAASGYATARYSGTETRAASYSGTGFFGQNWAPKSTGNRLYFGRAAYGRCVIPFISNETGTKGVPEHCDHRNPESSPTTGEKTYDQDDGSVYPFRDTAELYHFRAWKAVIAVNTLADLAGERFSARPDGELNANCLHDVACVVEDTDGYAYSFWDPIASVPFRALKGANVPLKYVHFAQDTAALAPSVQYLWVTETTAASGVAAAYLRWTSEGNGTWVLAVPGEGQYRIATRLADTVQGNENARIKSRETAAINDIIRPDDEYNWFSFSLKKLTTSTSKIQILDLAVNGTPMFTANLGGITVTIDASPTQYVGGWTSDTGDKHAAIGEFRDWDDGQGPDPDTGDNFDYLGGRVSENEYPTLSNNLLVYAKFQGDDVSGSALTHYGSAGPATLTLVGTATVVDGRNLAGSVAFPAAPAEYVTGVEILRSFAITILDPEDESEVQQALDEARAAPLFRLAIIPTGSTHYVDTADDSALGFEVDTRTGYTPAVIKGFFSWQGYIGIAGDRTTLHFAEPGPFGWESYPRWLDYEVPGAGGAVTAATSAGNLAYAFGVSWGVALGGSPGNPEPIGVGGGVGAADQRSVAVLGDIVFTHNGSLWAIRGAEAQDIGGPVRDLLPASGSARLVVSALLSSLLVIDLGTGDVLRYYLPTKRWSVESRDILAAGDLADGSAVAFVSQQGSWSKSNSAYVADDVEASTDTSGTGTLATDTVTLDANITIPTLARVQVEDAAGNSAAAVPTESGSTGTLTFPAGSMSALTDGAVTVRPGMPAKGHLIDTGWIQQGYNGFFNDVVYSIDSGSGWQIGSGGGSTPASKASRSGITFTDVAGTGERHGIGRGHRFIRAVVRNLDTEASQVGYLALGARAGGTQG